MHEFNELIKLSTTFNLNALNEAQERVGNALQTRADTTLVKTLQMVQLQKAISSIGMFSMFDAILQDQLKCKKGESGFQKAGQLLEAQGKIELKEKFSTLQQAINVLKHGKGRSYKDLVEKAASLPFKVKLPEEFFFDEGDVSEVATLIEVEDSFVLLCAEVIDEISIAIQQKSLTPLTCPL